MPLDEREKLEAAVIQAVLALFGGMNCSAYLLKIPNTSPPVYIVAGEVKKLKMMMPKETGE